MNKMTLIAGLLLAQAGIVLGADVNTLSPTEQAEGWQLLFDGQSLANWRASDAPGTFSVKDGEIVVHGPRSHLFYLGPVANHDFRNFELRVDLKTYPKANSNVYFHTQWQEKGWPEKGYEVQVNRAAGTPVLCRSGDGDLRAEHRDALAGISRPQEPAVPAEELVF